MGTVEMYYQYNHEYIFDSSKFEKAFNFKPTSYEDGIKEMSKTLYKPKASSLSSENQGSPKVTPLGNLSPQYSEDQIH